LPQVQKFAKTEEFKNGIPNAVGSLGGIGSLVKIDFKADPKQVIANVGNVIVPIISAGLCLIPGGALIAGIVSGVWSIVSALLGLGAGPSPMELAIDDIKKDIKELQALVRKVAGKLPGTVRKEADAKLKSIFHQAFHGELQRNNYVCTKYSMISKDFMDDIKNNRMIDESRRIEIIASIHDCDNFLKDTSEAFVFDDFAEVLWVPAVFTTLMRTTFLAEISNYGASLKIDKPIIASFWMEIKADIKRHFEFALKGMKDRVHSVGLQGDFHPSEYEACKLQTQILYTDREIYPYGVPKQFLIEKYEPEVRIADYNVTKNSGPLHLQIFH